MPAAALETLEATNIFCGDDPSASKHLVINNLKFPTMEEAMVDFVGGGAAMACDITTHFNKLEVLFSFAGWDEDTMGLVGMWAQAQRQFTLYGGLRNRLTGAVRQIKGVVFGKLTRAAPAEFTRATLNMMEYAVRAITRYDLRIDNNPIYYYDMASNSLIIQGTDILADINGALAIPASVAPTAELTNPTTQTIVTG